MAGTVREKVAGAGKATAESVGKAVGGAGTQARDAAPTPTGLLRQSLQNLAGTLAERATAKLSNRVSRTASRLTDYAEHGDGNLLAAVTGAEKLAGGASPVGAAVSGGMSKLGHTVREKFDSLKGAFGGGKKKGGGKKLKVTNIVEHVDVGVPVELAYDQWTQFADFPKFTKKLEQVEQVEDQKLTWTGKVFWSRRTWESTILEQVPFERIIWRSKGAKGYIDGAVTFHEIIPNFTRVLVVLEYHPQGVFEKTANLWRAAGRRCRLELKHFQRHVMTDSVLHAEEIVGWHGEIHDSEVVEDDESARRAESAEDEDLYEADDESDEDTDDESDEDRDDESDVAESDAEESDDDFEEDESEEDETAEKRTPGPRRSTRRRTAARRTTGGPKRKASR
ncbi:SRPBCC family protein [Nocardia takedensis]